MHLAVDLVDQGRILPVYGWGQYGKISIGWRALPKYHELLFIKEIAQSMPLWCFMENGSSVQGMALFRETLMAKALDSFTDIAMRRELKDRIP
jgi:hypothetical protein